MLDAVAWTCGICGFISLIVFGVVEPAHTRLGPGFTGRVRAKALSGVLFGLAAVATLWVTDASVQTLGFSWAGNLTGWAATAACAAIMLPIVAVNSSRPANWSTAPELRASSYTKGQLVWVATTWFVYLIGYEAFFRGALTHILVAELGLVRGLTIMTALYGVSHLTKRPSEAIGSFFIGPVFGWIAWTSGGFWPILVLHLGIALTNEYVAIWKNPDLNVT